MVGQEKENGGYPSARERLRELDAWLAQGKKLVEPHEYERVESAVSVTRAQWVRWIEEQERR
jgi:hypothetical protein